MGASYKQIKEIGKGAFGKVYLMEKDNKYYALKKIPINLLEKEEIDKYKEEINILSSFDNEYIIKYYDSIIGNNYINIYMEYGGDKNLKEFIESRENKLIEEELILYIILQICLGLKEIHRKKIIHRDLTPDNIFINEYNRIKIGDFGVSKRLGTFKRTAYTQVGKLHYIAPEIELGEKYNNKVDIYALGCIIYELFTLDKYYIDKFIKEKNCKIDTSIYNIRWQKLIDSLLEKDYNKRPNIEEVYDYIIKDEKARELIERINKKMDYDNNKKTWEIVNDNNSKKGLGFLCRISFLEEFQGLLILITNNQLLIKMIL